MKKSKITKKELARKVYDQILEAKTQGFWSLVLNSDGSFDTNRFIKRAKGQILSEYNIDVRGETLGVYLREFKRSAS